MFRSSTGNSILQQRGLFVVRSLPAPVRACPHDAAALPRRSRRVLRPSTWGSDEQSSHLGGGAVRCVHDCKFATTCGAGARLGRNWTSSAGCSHWDSGWQACALQRSPRGVSFRHARMNDYAPLSDHLDAPAVATTKHPMIFVCFVSSRGFRSAPRWTVPSVCVRGLCCAESQHIRSSPCRGAKPQAPFGLEMTRRR
jgi:hypothetical protein